MFIAALGILILYLSYVFIRYKCIPDSISDTFYLGTKYGFTFVMWAIGFLTVMSLLPITPIAYQFIAFLLAAGLLLVGAAPHFKESFEGGVHKAGALLFGFSSQAWAFIYGSPWLLITWILIAPLIKTRQKVFWIEIACIINLVIAYLL